MTAGHLADQTLNLRYCDALNTLGSEVYIYKSGFIAKTKFKLGYPLNTLKNQIIDICFTILKFNSTNLTTTM